LAETYKVGDVVQLKSGGPKMTVTASEAKTVHCVWFAGAKKEFGQFPPATLILPAEPEKPAAKSK
jgi:uncharacterized protein YodC (DUF2158 family)